MWRRLVNDHRIRIPRRKAHRLVRHRYYAQSPNYVWHVEGYDKLNLMVSVFMEQLTVTAGGFYGSKY